MRLGGIHLMCSAEGNEGSVEGGCEGGGRCGKGGGVREEGGVGREGV